MATPPSSTPGLYSCPLCSSPSPTLKLYVSHLRVLHSKDPLFSILCGVRGCREVFRTFSAFNSHIYNRHHRSDMGITAAEASRPPTLDLTDATSGTDQTERMECEEQDSQQDVGPLSTPLAHSSNRMRSSTEFDGTVMAAKMLLQLREDHRVSQVAISEVVSGVRTLCNQALDNLKADIVAALQTSGPEGLPKTCHLCLVTTTIHFKASIPTTDLKSSVLII